MDSRDDKLLRIIIFLIFTILSVSTAFLIKDSLAVLLTIGLIASRAIILRSCAFQSKRLTYIIFLSLDLGVAVWLPLKLWNDSVAAIDSGVVHSYNVLTCALIVVYFITLLMKTNNTERFVLRVTNADSWFFLVYAASCFLAFLFAVISHIYGLERMGVDSHALPFQLNGVVIFFKRCTFPILSLFALSYYYDRKKYKGVFWVGFIFFIFNILEVYVRLSKGQIIQYFMIPLFLWLISRYLFKLKWGALLLPLGLVFLLSLNFFNTLRHLTNSAVFSDQSLEYAINDKVDDTLSGKFEFVAVRVFRDYYFLDNFTSEQGINISSNQIKVVSSYGSPAAYYTFGVLGADPSKGTFSAGMSIFGEGYVYYGALGLIVSAIAYAFLTNCVDNQFLPRALRGVVLYPIICFMIYTFYFSGFWAWATKGLPIISWLVSLVLVVVLQSKIYRRVI